MKIKLKQLLKLLLELIYAIGVLCVVIFGITYVQHSTEIPYPDAMLPMMKYEVGAWRLMIGMPFMTISCVSVILINKIRKVGQILLLLLPAIVCLLIGIHYFITSL